MSNPALIVHVDAAAVLGALEQFPDLVAAHLKVSFKETADAIAREAKGRIRRRTGATGDAITVEESHDGKGYVVFVGDPRTYIGRFLEFGTVHMSAKPFLFVFLTTVTPRQGNSAHMGRLHGHARTCSNICV